MSKLMTQRRLGAILSGLLSSQGAAGNADVGVMEDEVVEIMLPQRHPSRQSSIQVRRATVADIPTLRAVTHCEPQACLHLERYPVVRQMQICERAFCW